jgi:hypothetical protein
LFGSCETEGRVGYFLEVLAGLAEEYGYCGLEYYEEEVEFCMVALVGARGRRVEVEVELV